MKKMLKINNLLFSLVFLTTTYSTITSNAQLILKNGAVVATKGVIDKSPEGLVKIAKQTFQEVLADKMTIDQALDILKKIDSKIAEVLERVLKLFASQPDLLTASEKVKTKAILKLFTLLEQLNFKANLERLADAFKEYSQEEFEELLSTSKYAHEALRTKVATRKRQKETEVLAVQAAQRHSHPENELDEESAAEKRISVVSHGA